MTWVLTMMLVTGPMSLGEYSYHQECQRARIEWVRKGTNANLISCQMQLAY